MRIRQVALVLPTPLSLAPLWLSLKVAVVAIGLAFPVSVLLAWWLAGGKRRRRGRLLLDTAVTLPLVLPPTVVGYGLLLLLGYGTPVGAWVNDRLGIRLLFTWPGASVAASVMAFPLLTRTSEAAFRSIDNELLEMARTQGASETALLTHIVLPLAYRGVVAGVGLGFARALGEFGATLMVAGNIPDRTQTLPLALYSAGIAGRTQQAAWYALLLIALAGALVAGIGVWGGQVAVARGENR